MVMLNAQTAKSEDDFSGRSHVDAGKYHVAVNACQEAPSRKKGTPGVEIEFQILADGVSPDEKTTIGGQTGKTISAFFAAVGDTDENTQRCMNNLTRLALAVGILAPGTAAEPDWGEAVGRELVILVKDDVKDKVKTGYTSVDWFGFWSLGNKAVVNVPKDLGTPGMQQLAKAGGSVNHPANGNGIGIAANSAAKPATTTRNKWSDL